MDNKKELLLKIKKLAEQGFYGEKKNAEELLKTIMKKYGITDSDLGIETISTHYFKITKQYMQLFIQICSSVILDFDGYHYTSRIMKGQKGVKCTVAEAMEIKIKLDIYIKDYEKQLKLFHNAFVMKNEIWPKHSNKELRTISSMSPEELEEWEAAQKISKGITKSEIQRRLEQGQK